MAVALRTTSLSRSILTPWGVVPALREASLEVAAGASLAVVGPSGSGKSTLLNVLGLLDTPTSGQLWLAGQETTRLSERRRARLRAAHLGFVFQSFHLIAHKDVVHNVALPLAYSGVPRSQQLTRAAELLEVVGLGARLDASPMTLSGGERQRAAVARAAILQPDVLLCDEPTGNLDDEASDVVLTVLLDLAKDRGAAVVMVTHDDEVARRCDDIAEMRDGVLTLARHEGASA